MAWSLIDNEQPQFKECEECPNIPDTLPILPLRSVVLFPRTVLPLAIGQERSLRLIETAFSNNRLLALVLEKEAIPDALNSPSSQRLAQCATAARIQHLVKITEGSVRIVVRGFVRLRLLEPTASDPYLVGRVARFPEVYDDSAEEVRLLRRAMTTFRKLASYSPSIADELESAAWDSRDPIDLTYLMAASLDLTASQRQIFLEMDPLSGKLERLNEIMEKDLRLQELGTRWRPSEMRSALEIIGQQVDKSSQVTQDRETGLY